MPTTNDTIAGRAEDPGVGGSHQTSHEDERRRHAKSMPQAGDAAVPTADAGEASNHLGQDDGGDVARSRDEHARDPSSTDAPGQRKGV